MEEDLKNYEKDDNKGISGSSFSNNIVGNNHINNSQSAKEGSLRSSNLENHLQNPTIHNPNQGSSSNNSSNSNNSINEAAYYDSNSSNVGESNMNKKQNKDLLGEHNHRHNNSTYHDKDQLNKGIRNDSIMDTLLIEKDIASQPTNNNAPYQANNLTGENSVKITSTLDENGNNQHDDDDDDDADEVGDDNNENSIGDDSNDGEEDEEIMELDRESSASLPSTKQNDASEDNKLKSANNNNTQSSSNGKERSSAPPRRTKHREVAELLKDAVSAATFPGTIFSCDICRSEPLLDRWHCRDCPNFDLCKDCHGKVVHDPTHRIEYIPKPPSLIQPTSRIGGAELGKISSNRSSDSNDSHINQGTFSINPNNITYNPRRRSTQVTNRAPHAAMDDMNHILDTADIGSMPPSSLSSSKALSFLQVYDTSLEAFRNSLTTVQPATGIPANSKAQRKVIENKADIQLLCLLAMAIAEISLPTRGAPSKKYKPAWSLTVSPRSAQIGDQGANSPASTGILNESPSNVRMKLPSTLMAVLAGLEGNDQKGWFIEPVPKTVKEYYEVIQRPSDLSTTRARLLAGDFNDSAISWETNSYEAAMTMIRRFRRSIRRIWHNAMIFYKKGHEIYDKAANLAKVFAFQIELICSRFGISYEELAGGDSKGEDGIGNSNNTSGLQASLSQAPKSSSDSQAAESGIVKESEENNDNRKNNNMSVGSNNNKKRGRESLSRQPADQPASPASKNKLQKVASATENWESKTVASQSNLPSTSSQKINSDKDIMLSAKLDKVINDQATITKDLKSLREEVLGLKSKIDTVVKALRTLSSDL